MSTSITTGRLDMTETEYHKALAGLEARAQLAEAHGQHRAAKSWRERAANLPKPASLPMPPGCVNVTSRVLGTMFALVGVSKPTSGAQGVRTQDLPER